MRIDAKNRAHRERYEVYLDGVNVSDCVQIADDISHEVTVVIRRPTGELVRNQGHVLTAILRGHVTIVAKVNNLAMIHPGS